jgi:hypothetical protein
MSDERFPDGQPARKSARVVAGGFAMESRAFALRRDQRRRANKAARAQRKKNRK